MRASVQFELRFLGVSHSELNRGKLADDAELEESLCGNALLSFLLPSLFSAFLGRELCPVCPVQAMLSLQLRR